MGYRRGARADTMGIMHRLVPALLAIACALPGAERTAADTATTAAKPPASLAQALVKSGDGWSWGGFAWVPGEHLTVATPIGPVTVNRALAQDKEAAKALPRLVALAEAGGASGTAAFQISPLAGLTLATKEWIAIEEGLLRAVPATEADREADRDAVAKAVAALTARIDADVAAGTIERRTRDAIVATLDLLPDKDRPTPLDEYTPSAARRLVRGGWLATLPQVGPETAAVEKAAAAAKQRTPISGHASADGRITIQDRRDAFGDGAWVLVSPTRTAYRVAHPEPFYNAALKHVLTVELPPGADPDRDAAKAIGARVFDRNGTRLATWTAKKGLSVDAKTWRKSVPRPDDTDLPDLYPPHIMVTTPAGDPVLLAVETGTLRAMRDGTEAEAERFLADAARTLDTLGRLDLLGQYFFRYTYDSPDPRFPLLAGNKTVKSDIHQTTAQILTSNTLGACRGDCDDLGELYQTVGERQGRLGHLLMLPSHTAYATATKAAEGWSVAVMQTGPTLHFERESLPEALRAAFTHFNPNAAFDPNGLGLLLRFSGENTRGAWRLGWRIFAEPEYARIMIDVQRDWQYQTYARGISKMQKLVDQGDTDPANITELSGLYHFTGQYAKAVEYFEKAMAGIDDPQSLALRRIELIGLLREAKNDARARVLIGEEIARLQDPELAAAMGQGMLEYGFDLAAQAAQLGMSASAAAILEVTAAPLDEQMGKVVTMLGNARFRERWVNDTGGLMLLRQMLARYADLSLDLVEKAPEAERSDAGVRAAEERAATWIDKIALSDVEDPGDIHFRYAALARHLARSMGGEEAVAAAVAAAPWPAAGKTDHTRRQAGEAQRTRDLSWIRMSVPYWFGQQLRAYNDDAVKAGTADLGKVRAAAARVEEAFTRAEALGLTDSSIEIQRHMSRLDLALLTEDKALLQSCLRRVKDLNDKRLRDMTADTLGARAPQASAAWFTTVLDVWQAELNYKPKWFLIAWRAVLVGANERALTAAERAVKAFPDDAAFREELSFMRDLLK
jgi:tetratricopeptide (TPR) repeat protein